MQRTHTTTIVPPPTISATVARLGAHGRLFYALQAFFSLAFFIFGSQVLHRPVLNRLVLNPVSQTRRLAPLGLLCVRRSSR